MLDLGQERELLSHDATSPPSGIKSVDGIVMMNGASGGHVVDSDGTTLVGSSTDTNGYTAAGWAETAIIDDANGRFRYFFGASTNTRGFALGLKAHTSSDTIRGVHFHIKHAASSLSVIPDSSKSPPIAGKAQLYTGTWTPGDGARSYLDGIFVRYGAYTQSDSRMSSLLEIGQTPDPQNWTSNTYTWDAGVGPCFLWNRPLSDAEIRALYNPQTRWDIFDKGYRLITIGTADTTPPATDLTLEAQSGLIHVTGQSSSINLSRDLEATSALVHLLGQSTNVNLSRLLESTSGLVHLTGQSTSANLARNLESTSGLVHLTGQHTQTTFGRILQVQSALVHLTGQSTSINLARNLASTSGLIHLTGQDAQLLLSKTVLSQSALVHLAGQDVQVLTNRDLLTTSGLVYIIGQDSSITLSSMRPQWARMLNTVITVGDRSRKT
jgi:hypothetical protein